MLDLGSLRSRSLADRRVGADVAVASAARPRRRSRGRARSCAPGARRPRSPRARRPASRSARRRTRSGRLSRIRRLASSMSSRRPVSFHQPRTMCGSTRRPPSSRCWIASVISSSPRAEGSIARAASWICAVNMYTPTSARSVAGLGRLLDQAHDPADARPGRRRPRPARPRRSSPGPAPASAGSARRASARGRPPRARRCRPAAGCRRGTSRTGSSPRNGSAVSTACASPSGSSWRM